MESDENDGANDDFDEKLLIEPKVQFTKKDRQVAEFYLRIRRAWEAKTAASLPNVREDESLPSRSRSSSVTSAVEVDERHQDATVPTEVEVPSVLHTLKYIPDARCRKVYIMGGTISPTKWTPIKSPPPSVTRPPRLVYDELPDLGTGVVDTPNDLVSGSDPLLLGDDLNIPDLGGSSLSSEALLEAFTGSVDSYLSLHDQMPDDQLWGFSDSDPADWLYAEHRDVLDDCVETVSKILRVKTQKPKFIVIPYGRRRAGVTTVDVFQPAVQIAPVVQMSVSPIITRAVAGDLAEVEEAVEGIATVLPTAMMNVKPSKHIAFTYFSRSQVGTRIISSCEVAEEPSVDTTLVRVVGVIPDDSYDDTAKALYGRLHYEVAEAEVSGVRVLQHYVMRDLSVPLVDLSLTHPQFLPEYKPNLRIPRILNKKSVNTAPVLAVKKTQPVHAKKTTLPAQESKNTSPVIKIRKISPVVRVKNIQGLLKTRPVVSLGPIETKLPAPVTQATLKAELMKDRALLSRFENTKPEKASGDSGSTDNAFESNNLNEFLSLPADSLPADSGDDEESNDGFGHLEDSDGNDICISQVWSLGSPAAKQAASPERRRRLIPIVQSARSSKSTSNGSISLMGKKIRGMLKHDRVLTTSMAIRRQMKMNEPISTSEYRKVLKVCQGSLKNVGAERTNRRDMEPNKNKPESNQSQKKPLVAMTPWNQTSTKVELLYRKSRARVKSGKPRCLAELTNPLDEFLRAIDVKDTERFAEALERGCYLLEAQKRMYILLSIEKLIVGRQRQQLQERINELQKDLGINSQKLSQSKFALKLDNCIDDEDHIKCANLNSIEDDNPDLTDIYSLMQETDIVECAKSDNSAAHTDRLHKHAPNIKESPVDMASEVKECVTTKIEASRGLGFAAVKLEPGTKDISVWNENDMSVDNWPQNAKPLGGVGKCAMDTSSPSEKTECAMVTSSPSEKTECAMVTSSPSEKTECAMDTSSPSEKTECAMVTSLTKKIVEGSAMGASSVNEIGRKCAKSTSLATNGLATDAGLTTCRVESLVGGTGVPTMAEDGGDGRSCHNPIIANLVSSLVKDMSYDDEESNLRKLIDNVIEKVCDLAWSPETSCADLEERDKQEVTSLLKMMVSKISEKCSNHAKELDSTADVMESNGIAKIVKDTVDGIVQTVINSMEGLGSIVTNSDSPQTSLKPVLDTAADRLSDHLVTSSEGLRMLAVTSGVHSDVLTLKTGERLDDGADGSKHGIAATSLDDQVGFECSNVNEDFGYVPPVPSTPLELVNQSWCSEDELDSDGDQWPNRRLLIDEEHCKSSLASDWQAMNFDGPSCDIPNNKPTTTSPSSQSANTGRLHPEQCVDTDSDSDVDEGRLIINEDINLSSCDNFPSDLMTAGTADNMKNSKAIGSNSSRTCARLSNHVFYEKDSMVHMIGDSDSHTDHVENVSCKLSLEGDSDAESANDFGIISDSYTLQTLQPSDLELQPSDLECAFSKQPTIDEIAISMGLRRTLGSLMLPKSTCSKLIVHTDFVDTLRLSLHDGVEDTVHNLIDAVEDILEPETVVRSVLNHMSFAVDLHDTTKSQSINELYNQSYFNSSSDKRLCYWPEIPHRKPSSSAKDSILSADNISLVESISVNTASYANSFKTAMQSIRCHAHAPIKTFKVKHKHMKKLARTLKLREVYEMKAGMLAILKNFPMKPPVRRLKRKHMLQPKSICNSSRRKSTMSSVTKPVKHADNMAAAFRKRKKVTLANHNIIGKKKRDSFCPIRVQKTAESGDIDIPLASSDEDDSEDDGSASYIQSDCLDLLTPATTRSRSRRKQNLVSMTVTKFDRYTISDGKLSATTRCITERQRHAALNQLTLRLARATLSAKMLSGRAKVTKQMVLTMSMVRIEHLEKDVNEQERMLKFELSRRSRLRSQLRHILDSHKMDAEATAKAQKTLNPHKHCSCKDKMGHFCPHQHQLINALDTSDAFTTSEPLSVEKEVISTAESSSSSVTDLPPTVPTTEATNSAASSTVPFVATSALYKIGNERLVHPMESDNKPASIMHSLLTSAPAITTTSHLTTPTTQYKGNEILPSTNNWAYVYRSDRDGNWVKLGELVKSGVGSLASVKQTLSTTTCTTAVLNTASSITSSGIPYSQCATIPKALPEREALAAPNELVASAADVVRKIFGSASNVQLSKLFRAMKPGSSRVVKVPIVLQPRKPNDDNSVHLTVYTGKHKLTIPAPVRDVQTYSSRQGTVFNNALYSKQSSRLATKTCSPLSAPVRQVNSADRDISEAGLARSRILIAGDKSIVTDPSKAVKLVPVRMKPHSPTAQPAKVKSPSSLIRSDSSSTLDDDIRLVCNLQKRSYDNKRSDINVNKIAKNVHESAFTGVFSMPVLATERLGVQQIGPSKMSATESSDLKSAQLQNSVTTNYSQRFGSKYITSKTHNSRLENVAASSCIQCDVDPLRSKSNGGGMVKVFKRPFNEGCSNNAAKKLVESYDFRHSPSPESDDDFGVSSDSWQHTVTKTYSRRGQPIYESAKSPKHVAPCQAAVSMLSSKYSNLADKSTNKVVSGSSRLSRVKSSEKLAGSVKSNIEIATSVHKRSTALLANVVSTSIDSMTPRSLLKMQSPELNKLEELHAGSSRSNISKLKSIVLPHSVTPPCSVTSSSGRNMQDVSFVRTEDVQSVISNSLAVKTKNKRCPSTGIMEPRSVASWTSSQPMSRLYPEGKGGNHQVSLAGSGTSKGEMDDIDGGRMDSRTPIGSDSIMYNTSSRPVSGIDAAIKAISEEARSTSRPLTDQMEVINDGLLSSPSEKAERKMEVPLSLANEALSNEVLPKTLQISEGKVEDTGSAKVGIIDNPKQSLRSLLSDASSNQLKVGEIKGHTLCTMPNVSKRRRQYINGLIRCVISDTSSQGQIEHVPVKSSIIESGVPNCSKTSETQLQQVMNSSNENMAILPSATSDGPVADVNSESVGINEVQIEDVAFENAFINKHVPSVMSGAMRMRKCVDYGDESTDTSQDTALAQLNKLSKKTSKGHEKPFTTKTISCQSIPRFETEIVKSMRVDSGATGTDSVQARPAVSLLSNDHLRLSTAIRHAAPQEAITSRILNQHPSQSSVVTTDLRQPVITIDKLAATGYQVPVRLTATPLHIVTYNGTVRKLPVRPVVGSNPHDCTFRIISKPAEAILQSVSGHPKTPESIGRAAHTYSWVDTQSSAEDSTRLMKRELEDDQGRPPERISKKMKSTISASSEAKSSCGQSNPTNSNPQSRSVLKARSRRLCRPQRSATGSSAHKWASLRSRMKRRVYRLYNTTGRLMSSWTVNRKLRFKVYRGKEATSAARCIGKKIFLGKHREVEKGQMLKAVPCPRSDAGKDGSVCSADTSTGTQTSIDINRIGFTPPSLRHVNVSTVQTVVSSADTTTSRGSTSRGQQVLGTPGKSLDVLGKHGAFRMQGEPGVHSRRDIGSTTALHGVNTYTASGGDKPSSADSVTSLDIGQSL